MEMFPTLTSKFYKDIRNEIRSGDLLLCSGSSVFSNLIKKATNSVWSHVGFILRVDPIDRIMVLESVESIGVRTIPLSSYVADYNASGQGYPGRMMIARHADVREENITNLSKNAVDLLGYPYGTDEIVRIATRISMHALGVLDHLSNPTPQHEFICSEYAYICFKSIGITIDYNSLGFITPADFARHPKITPLFYIENELKSKQATPVQHAHSSSVISSALRDS